MPDVREIFAILVRLMTDTPWCDEVEAYVPMDGPARGDSRESRVKPISSAAN